MDVIHLYIPEKNLLLSFEQGTGDNLLPEDEASGFNDYLNWYTKSLDQVEPEEDDGGMVLFNHDTNNFNEDMLSAIPYVLDEAFDDPTIRFILLANTDDLGVGDMMTMMTISSGHITEQTMQALEDEVTDPFGELHLAVYRKEACEAYGWYIYLTGDKLDFDKDKYPDLDQVILFATKLGVDILCLDGEGEVLKDLTFYSED